MAVMDWTDRRKRIANDIEYDRVRARSVAVMNEFNERQREAKRIAAEKKAAFTMRDYNYWAMNYLDQDRPLPREVTLYSEEILDWNLAKFEEDKRAFMKSFWPWFWICAGFVGVITTLLIIGMPATAMGLFICALILLAVHGIVDSL